MKNTLGAHLSIAIDPKLVKYGLHRALVQGQFPPSIRLIFINTVREYEQFPEAALFEHTHEI